MEFLIWWVKISYICGQEITSCKEIVQDQMTLDIESFDFESKILGPNILSIYKVVQWPQLYLIFNPQKEKLLD